jgi:predicted MarR family transcription regulator
VQSEKQGKKVFYGNKKQGQALCMTYRDVRESFLVDEYAAFGDGSGKSNAASLSEVARQLKLLSGLYDQTARSATTFKQYDLDNICCRPG